MALIAKNLSFARANKYLFRNLNINLSAGEMLCVRGPNGSGKTTLLKVLAGMMIPDKGQITWDQQSIQQSEHYHARLSYLGHKDGLKLALSVVDNIQIQLALSNTHASKEEMMKACEIFGLSQYPTLACQKLSAGLKRKVALTAIILKRKPLWILD
jgi:heme exporter protein A